MPRLFRESPLNGIWEGSGNVMCLDVLRAMAREPQALEAFLAELDAAAGADRRLDAAVARVRAELADLDGIEARARRVVEAMALAFQGSLLVRYGHPAVADAFCASRLAGDEGLALGTLPPGGRRRHDHRAGPPQDFLARPTARCALACARSNIPRRGTMPCPTRGMPMRTRRAAAPLVVLALAVAMVLGPSPAGAGASDHPDHFAVGSVRLDGSQEVPGGRSRRGRPVRVHRGRGQRCATSSPPSGSQPPAAAHIHVAPAGSTAPSSSGWSYPTPSRPTASRPSPTRRSEQCDGADPGGAGRHHRQRSWLLRERAQRHVPGRSHPRSAPLTSRDERRGGGGGPPRPWEGGSHLAARSSRSSATGGGATSPAGPAPRRRPPAPPGRTAMSATPPRSKIRAIHASMAHAWGVTWPIARMTGGTMSSGHMQPPSMPRAMAIGVAWRPPGPGRGRSPRPRRTGPPPVATRANSQDQHDRRQGVAPGDAEHHRPDGDDQRRLQQGQRQLGRPEAGEDRAGAVRRGQHPPGDALACARWPARPGHQRVDEREQHEVDGAV